MTGVTEMRNPPWEAGSQGAQVGGLDAGQEYHDLPRVLPTSKTVQARVLAALRSGRCLTSAHIWREFGSSRASATIFSLRKKGHDILTERIDVPTRDGRVAHVALYSLEATS